MYAEMERRRALLAVSPEEEPALRALFAREALTVWETTLSDNFEKARFILQHGPYDVLLVDASLVAQQGEAGLTWLAQQREVPTVFLADVSGRLWAQAFEYGVSACVPRQLSFEQPMLLAAALQRASQCTQMLRGQRQTREALRQCRRQVDRLVELLWRTTPLEPPGTWFTQRHIMERLREEVARSGRHGTPLTVALGEFQVEEETDVQSSDWASRQIALVKRRCDVAGQYGLRGFLLLMVHTSAAGALTCCRRLQRTLEEGQAPRADAPNPLRACFGVASFQGKNDTLQGLLSSAEQRLETAKKGPGERVVAN